MMVVYIEIAVYPDAEIKKSVTGESVQHVIKKTDSCLNIRVSGSVQHQFQLDLSFFCISFYGCFSCHITVFSIILHFQNVPPQNLRAR